MRDVERPNDAIELAVFWWKDFRENEKYEGSMRAWLSPLKCFFFKLLAKCYIYILNIFEMLNQFLFQRHNFNLRTSIYKKI